MVGFAFNASQGRVIYLCILGKKRPKSGGFKLISKAFSAINYFFLILRVYLYLIILLNFLRSRHSYSTNSNLLPTLHKKSQEMTQFFMFYFVIRTFELQ